MTMTLEYVPTVCPYCGCGCGIHLVVRDGRIVGVEPWKEHPVNEGKNCPKGRNAFHFLYADGRLDRPLVRDNGSLREASWEEALDLVAARLKDADPDAVGFINSGKLTNEDLYVLQKLVRCALKTNNMDNCSRFCHSTTVPALVSTVGSGVMPTSQADIEQADCIVIAGVNVKETYPLIARRIIRAKQSGARVIVVDPRRTVTATSLADIHLQLKPATDVALANAMMKTIFEEGLKDDDFIERRTRGAEELRAYLAASDMGELAEITGVPIHAIKEAARTYAQAETGCILYNAGIAQHAAGIGNIRALADLALLTGNYGRPGAGVSPLRGHLNGEGFGDMGPLAVFYPGFRRVNEESAKLFEGHWGVKGLPSEPGMSYMDMLENCDVLYVIGANPMASAPNTNRVREMLARKELLVVQDIFMTETAALADIVLPAAAWAERDGTVTEVDRRVQRVGKAVDPPGEARPDWEIFCGLARIMETEGGFDYTSPEEIFEEIRKTVPQYSGITYERLKKAGGIQWPCSSEDHPGTGTMFVEKFATPDGRGHFQVVDYKEPLETTDEEYPYALTNGRLIFHYHSGTMSRRTRRLRHEVPGGFVEISVQDARDKGIEDGDEVKLESRRGEVRVIAKVTNDIGRGVLFMPWHFPESGPNILTGPCAGPPSKMPEFKFCAVRIEAIG
jgi:formate dehydrogenase major subunit